MSWIGLGLRGGILTTRYPLGPDEMPGSYRGAIRGTDARLEGQEAGAGECLSNAIIPGPHRAQVDPTRCFQCGECTRVSPKAFQASAAFELAMVEGTVETAREKLRARARAFGRSVHLRHVDAGSDGSEEQELSAIFNPFYDANRLGIFLTATPRHADVLIVTGVVTKPMREPLLRTFEAMPEPKTVVALGTSACSGGIFSGSPAVIGPVSSVLPVDVMIPGAPPAPLSILHGLWVALGHALAQGATE
jgi:Ni,Fe-hydrogenase III small subunit